MRLLVTAKGESEKSAVYRQQDSVKVEKPKKRKFRSLKLLVAAKGESAF